MTTQATVTSTIERSRKTLKKLGRGKRKLKLKTNAEFAKGYFDGKSKRSIEKKAAFRKKKKNKK